MGLPRKKIEESPLKEFDDIPTPELTPEEELITQNKLKLETHIKALREKIEAKERLGQYASNSEEAVNDAKTIQELKKDLYQAEMKYKTKFGGQQELELEG